MERHAPLHMNRQIYGEACSWFVEARAGDLDDSGRRELDRWLRRSPENVCAYLEIAAIWSAGTRFAISEEWPTEALLRDAAEMIDDNLVPLEREVNGKVLREHVGIRHSDASADSESKQHIPKDLRG